MLRDLRYAVRTLVAAPGFAIVAIPSLALGIGVNSAMFSSADALLLRPLEVPRADEVICVNGSGPDITNGLGGVSYPDYVDLRDWNRSFKGLIAFTYRSLAMKTDPNALSELREGMGVSVNFFRAMEVAPEMGRDFLAKEDRSPVVILSHNAWEIRFAADPKIVGRFIRLNDIEFEVIGVAPRRFNGLSMLVHPDVYFPIRNRRERRDGAWDSGAVYAIDGEGDFRSVYVRHLAYGAAGGDDDCELCSGEAGGGD